MDGPAAETSSLSLPQNLANILSTGQDIRIAFTFYRESNLFPVREKQMYVDRSIVGSPVIGATVSGLPNETELDPLVLVVLLLTHAPIPVEDENITRRCAFWDFTGNGIINYKYINTFYIYASIVHQFYIYSVKLYFEFCEKLRVLNNYNFVCNLIVVF